MPNKWRLVMNVSSIGIQTKNVEEMIVILKQGLPVDAFDNLRDRLKVSDNLLSNIVQISKRTLNRRRQDGRLKTDESERIFRIARVYDMALDVFESEEAVVSWLKKPARGLGHKVPLEYSDTDLGAQEVVNLLGRIEHGVFLG
jgi:putative toxin-antitoxin system antitoxin component (TIGR02293 family)